MAITLWRPKVFSHSRMDSDDWSDFVFSMDDMFSGFHFETGYRPLMETYVNGNELHLQAEIPGVDPKDVDMSLEDGHICIIGGLKRAHADEGSCYCVEEISYGAFCRCFHVPEDVEHNKIHAIYDHGILDVGVPFRNSTVGRKIPIESMEENREGYFRTNRRF